MQMQISTQENAYKIVLQEINKLEKFVPNKVIPTNKGRYHIIESFGSDNIMIMFKTELFQSFGQKMRELGHLDASGIGESINCDSIKLCIQYEVQRIFSVFPDGKIYVIPLEEFLKESKKWRNKEGKEVRSISVHEFKRFNLD